VIPLVDLKAQYRQIGEEIEAEIREVLISGKYVLGEKVEVFEAAFAEYCGVKYACGVNSGTSALHLALLAAGVGPGDEVITVPFTFVATAAAITYCGARPVFVDIHPRWFTMDVEQLAAAITPRTKAILPVHLYGQPAEMEAVMEIAQRYGLAVIEDAAQAHGARYHGRRVGGIGDLGCFSFYPTKNLGAFGEGGMVVTNEAQLADRIRRMRDWGQREKYHHELLGFNYRMEALQGTVLAVKLCYLDRWTAARRAHAARYHRLLTGSGVGLPEEMPETHHVYHAYTVTTPQRDALRAHLWAHGIQSAIHYPLPLHLQPVFAHLGYQRGDFPHAEAAARQVLSLPIYPELDPGDVTRVAEAVHTFFNETPPN
jgi:dTDP-4-amino-4,6-dideoxygalactose transaminase